MEMPSFRLSSCAVSAAFSSSSPSCTSRLAWPVRDLAGVFILPLSASNTCARSVVARAGLEKPCVTRGEDRVTKIVTCCAFGAPKWRGVCVAWIDWVAQLIENHRPYGRLQELARILYGNRQGRGATRGDR